MFSKGVALVVSNLFLMTVLMPMTAMAQVAEVRIGVSEFDERTLDLDPNRTSEGERANDENSISVSGEILFEEPKLLKWALSPQPYIGGTLNLEGKTSFGGAGLLWRQTVGQKFYGDFGVGLVVHDGAKRSNTSSELEDLFAQRRAGLGNFDDLTDDIDAELRRLNNQIRFGSRVLFRLQWALGINLHEDWAGEVYVEHLSNGGIFSTKANEGVNNLGIRAVRKF